MHVPDVNVLLNVSLEASSQHQAAVDWLVAAGNGAEPVAVPAMVLLSYVRIISGTGVGPARKTVDEAFAFCENVASMPAYLSVAEGPRHWRLFQETVRGGGISGADITDAYLAAFALENDATFVTFDRGFRRFPGLRLLVLELTAARAAVSDSLTANSRLGVAGPAIVGIPGRARRGGCHW